MMKKKKHNNFTIFSLGYIHNGSVFLQCINTLIKK